MSIIKNMNLTLKLGFTKISINKNFHLLTYLERMDELTDIGTDNELKELD